MAKKDSAIKNAVEAPKPVMNAQAPVTAQMPSAPKMPENASANLANKKK